ncbi:hypothetical protein N781_07020 [Pontibacillus halophilus JSM 076056 = DSM 19796]|uniref:ABC transmembrane type-1 domain-containing protein n=1 Tax=Pontibacillus halophilus JSM 076056 = DSM 19796 TaxID=1385510 RepID=A0A0A5I436_9BACI|nr:hypothetical protein [Pontibacillus halophilus]KGX90587.1 hypothetical protein N781_07020 [Pontibacillus halophilus JSM 076056 = DSM 19796]
MRFSRQIKVWGMLAPTLLFLIIPLYGLYSGIKRSLIHEGLFSFHYYSELFQRSVFWESLLYSIGIALVSTTLSLLIGLSFTRWFYPYVNRLSGKLSVWVSMLFPHFVWGYVVLILFQQSGLLAQLGIALGIWEATNEVPVVTNDALGIGILLTYIGKEVPFVILMLLPVYIGMNTRYDDMVRTLGGGKWRRFKDAEWPWIYPILMETGIILFAFIMSAFEVPFLLGSTFKEMVSIVTYDWFYSGDFSERPLALAAMIVTSVVIGLVAFVMFRLTSKTRWLLSKGAR